jgi:hypothetical protein
MWTFVEYNYLKKWATILCIYLTTRASSKQGWVFEVQGGSGIQEQNNYVESYDTIREVFEMEHRDINFNII